MKNSNFSANTRTLVRDALHAASILKDPSSSAKDLHSVCAVVLLDSQQANSSLPTPDATATTLLGRAYGQMGAGANTCYRAQSNVVLRTEALSLFARGSATLSEGSARLTAALAP